MWNFFTGCFKFYYFFSNFLFDFRGYLLPVNNFIHVTYYFLPMSFATFPPFVIIFIIFLVSSNCFRSLFTSCTLVPLPDALLFRLLPFRTTGDRKSVV